MNEPSLDLSTVTKCKEKLDRLTPILASHMYKLVETRPFPEGYKPLDPTINLSSGTLVVSRVRAGWTSYLEKNLYDNLRPPWNPDPKLGERIPVFSAFALIGAYTPEEKKKMFLHVSARSAIIYGLTVNPVNLELVERDLEELGWKEQAELKGLARDAAERVMNEPKGFLFLKPDPEKVRIYKELRAIVGNPYGDRYGAELVFARHSNAVRRIVPREPLREVEQQMREKRREINELKQKVKRIDLLDGIQVRARLEPHYEITLVRKNPDEKVGIAQRTSINQPPIRFLSRTEYRPTPEQIKQGLQVKSGRTSIYWQSVSECDKSEIVDALGLLAMQLPPVD